jgi:hypothetical protein
MVEAICGRASVEGRIWLKKPEGAARDMCVVGISLEPMSAKVSI